MISKIQIPKKELHFLVCVTSREHLPEPKKPDCGSKIKKEDLKDVRIWLKNQGLFSKVKITATHCLGICAKEGPVCLVYPEQEYYIFDTVEDLKKLIIDKLK